MGVFFWGGIIVAGTYYGIAFEIVLYGDAGCTIELGRTRTTLNINPMAGPFIGGQVVPIDTIKIPKGYPVYAKIACSDGAYSLDIALKYKAVHA
jgi:hypothetical protein